MQKICVDGPEILDQVYFIIFQTLDLFQKKIVFISSEIIQTL
jgi:hypothetical protein